MLLTTWTLTPTRSFAPILSVLVADTAANAEAIRRSNSLANPFADYIAKRFAYGIPDCVSDPIADDGS